MIKRLILFIIAPVFNFLQSCLSPLGQCIDEKVSDSYYYSKSEDEVIYSPMGNWFELGKTKFKADARSFTPLSREIGKDKNHIYFEHSIQQQVDYATFNINGLIIRDKHHVYYNPHDYKQNLLTIEDADPETFQFIPMSNKQFYPLWAMDKNHYYLNYKKIAVDYHSFEFLTTELVADDTYLYLAEDDTLSIKDTLTNKIERINTTYFKMDNTIYYTNPYYGFHKIQFKKIEQIKATDQHYIQVNNQVFVQGKRFPYSAVDAETFETFPDWDYIYTRDKSHVYLDGEIIEGADIRTFELPGQRYGKDKNHVYYEKEIMPGVSPEKFFIRDGMTPTDGKTNFIKGKPEGKSR